MSLLTGAVLNPICRPVQVVSSVVDPHWNQLREKRNMKYLLVSLFLLKYIM